MSRFFVDPACIYGRNITIDDPEDVKHISRVLRMREGDELLISDGIEWEYNCTIESIDRNEIVTVINDKQKHSIEPRTKITLFQGVPKQGKMDLTVQKCTELGVTEFIPVFMDRTVVSDKGNFHKKIDRLNAIAESAAKQCQRNIIPKVKDAVDFDAAVDMAKEFDLFLFPYENEDGKTIRDALKEFADGLDAEKEVSVAIIIGPEGGFSDEEAETLKAIEGCHCVTLGKTILRTETAGFVAVSMCMYELEL